LAVTFVMLSLFARLSRIEWSDRRGGVQYWFVVLTAAIFTFQPQYLFGVLAADSVVAVLIVYWVALALGFSRSGDRRTTFGLLVVSAVLATAVKISAAPLLVLTMALGWSHRKEGVTGAAGVWAIAAVLLSVWMLHGVLLSGCAVYPLRATCFSGLPWAVLPQQVDDINIYMRAWARHPEEPDFARVLQDWSWLPQWFSKARKNRSMEFLLAGVLLGALATASAGAEIWARPRDDLALIATGLAASLGFWFLSAPAVRFGAGFILAAALFGLSLAGAAWLHRPRFYSCAPLVLIFLMMLSALCGLGRLRVEGFFNANPGAAVYQFRTTQRVRLWVPRAGDQCWAHELPCTPYVNSAALARVRWPGACRASRNANDPHLEPPPGWMPLSGADGELSGRVAYQRHPSIHD
jgi:hypothetical protein